jgi:hypothetical protein
MRCTLLSLFFLQACSTLFGGVERVPYTGPIYVIDVKNVGAQRSTREKVDCSVPENKELCFVPFENMDNFVCVPPEDIDGILGR